MSKIICKECGSGFDFEAELKEAQDYSVKTATGCCHAEAWLERSSKESIEEIAPELVKSAKKQLEEMSTEEGIQGTQMPDNEKHIIQCSKEFNDEMQELADKAEANSMRDYIEQGDEE